MIERLEPTIAVGSEGDRTLVTLAGEWDVSHVAELRERLEALDADRDVLFDLTGTTFIDSTIITALLEARKRSEQAGRDSFARVREGGMIRRVFTLMGLDRVFELVP